MAWRVGIDIGGTFTDITAADTASGEIHFRKVPSVPADLARGAAEGLAVLGEAVPLPEVSFFAHGTTAGTNALIEDKGARTGLITTQGFRDLLEIARQRRPSLYDLSARKPRPLVARRLRREAPERLHPDGSVMRPLDCEATRRELAFLKEAGVEALAICCLHSYADPRHEKAIKELARELLPGVYVSASSDVLPRFREYERLSTTVVNAYLGPLMGRYLDKFGRRGRSAGIAVSPHIMQSNGGLAALEEAREKPVTTILSGPAAGAAAAAAICADLGLARAISIDMGGTSSDVCLIEGGLPAVASGREVGGYAVEVPGANVRCIGAGGGSIVSVDEGGLPQVGPRSAGADPGPACYGRGGEEPTLTDALLLLGRLSPQGLLGGEMRLDPGAALGGLAENVARPLGISPRRAALGTVELAVANVRRAVEALTVREGRDPRDYALIAAGGAGPLIACELAAELGIEQVIVPLSPGNFSAWGLLASDLRRDWVQTRLTPLRADSLAALSEGYRALEVEARCWLEAHAPTGAGTVLRQVAARYFGQDYELSVDVPPGALGPHDLTAVRQSFHAAHDQHYGYSLPEQELEVVDLLVSAIARTAALPGSAAAAAEGVPEPKEERLVHARGGDEQCLVYHRSALGEGATVSGTAIIEQYDSTTYLPKGWRAQVAGGALRVRRE